jgi:hypothetical protein
MLIIAHHTNISDPQTFWSKAQTLIPAAPAGTQIHAVYPSQDGKTGTCLWEADTVEEVQQFLDKEAGDLATNFCYEVNEAVAIGAPATKKAAALN